MIELQDVNKYYNANGVTNLGLRHINLKLNKGEIVAITGESGSGKSTLLNVIAKVDTFDEGEIYYKGNETSYFSIDDMDDFRKNKVGFIFQNYNIIDSYTVLQNVMLPLCLRGLDKKEAKKQALDLIKRVNLGGKERSKGSKLSGGEKQRCVIARALASNCEILVCDEPTGNLDSKTGKEIIELIKEVAQDKLVLIVTHDFEIVKDIVTRKIRIADGEIVEDVIYKAMPDDEDEVLDLDYKPLKKKIDFEVAKNNVTNTPKKTIFVGIIFSVIALILLLIFQFLGSITSNLNYNNSYSNLQDNRVYVYDINHQELDIDKIKDITSDYEINPFFEDQSFNVKSASPESDEGLYYSDYIYSFNCYYNDHVDYKLEKGVFPDANSTTDIFVILPSDKKEDIKTYNNNVGSKITIYSSKECSFTLKGFGTSSQIDSTIITGNNYLKNILKKSNIKYKVSYRGLDVTVEESDDSAYPTIVLPSNYDNENVESSKEKISFKINDIYDAKYDVVYEAIESPVLRIGKDYLFDDQVFEVTAYGSSTSKIARKIKNIGYCADIVNNLQEEESVTTFIMNLTSYALMIGAFVNMFLFFIITYFILSKVYSSRKKDYEILRILGVTKKDMKKIVKYELFTISTTCMVLVYVILTILIHTTKFFAGIGTIKFVTTLIYIAAIMILTSFIVHFFNKKLFKFSVVKSMKGDAK